MNAEADPAGRCALPGCDELIEPAPGRSNRLYCTAAHRSAARQSRRTAVQPDAAASYAWLNEPAPPAPPAAVDGPAPGASPGPVVPSATGEAGTDGCATPARRFAGGAAAARRAVSSWTGSARSSGAGRPRSPSLTRQQGLARRRRAVAVLGAATILLGGYSVTTGAQAPDRSAPVPSPATGADQWASQARLTLVSLDSQLGSIARTEAAWNAAQQDGRRFDGTPIPVQRLMQLKAVLQQQRATLLSQLSAYESLATARQELSTADRRLADLTSATPGAPPTGGQSPTEAATTAAWDQQRALREAQRAAKLNELNLLLGSVQAALATPLPVRAVETRAATDSVLSLLRDEVPPSQRRPTAPDRAALAEGRKPSSERVADDVGTSGPPDPRGPRDEAGPAPDPGGAVPAAVDTVTRPVRDAGNAVRDGATGAVDSVTGGGDPDGPRTGTARGAGRTVEPVSSVTDAEPVAAVTDTLDDAATAVTGDDGGAADRATGPSAPALDRAPQQRGPTADQAALGTLDPGPFAEVVDLAGQALARQGAAAPDSPADADSAPADPGTADDPAADDPAADDPAADGSGEPGDTSPVPEDAPSDSMSPPGSDESGASDEDDPADDPDPVDDAQDDDAPDPGPDETEPDDTEPDDGGSDEDGSDEDADGAEEPSDPDGPVDGSEPPGDDPDTGDADSSDAGTTDAEEPEVDDSEQD